MAKTPAYRYRGFLDYVRDGDSASIRLDLGFHASLTIPIRIADVNTPERNQDGYYAAKNFLQELLQDKELIVETRKLKKGNDAMTFERYVANLWVDGNSVAEEIIRSGYGVKVDGSK